LAQVGKGRVTAPAIYLIETGRTRPSLPTLEHIAHRTGKPVEFFLADPSGTADDAQASVADLEAMVGDGLYAQAIELGESLLDLGTAAHRLGRIRYFLAMAYVQMGQTGRAEDLLAQARAHFEAINDGAMLAECMGAQASLAYLNQRPDALAIAEEALAVCRNLDPVPLPTEAHLLGILATAHVANLDWDKAVSTFKEAIEAGKAFVDLRMMARMYRGLSNAYKELGQIDAATRYATRSVALLEVLRDRVALARSENNLGLILTARGDAAGAREHLDRSLALGAEADLQLGRSRMLINLCELCLQEGSVDRAAEFARDALELATQLKEGVNVADAHMWLGRIADRQGDAPGADREFALAIRGLEELGRRESLFHLHGVYAEILERRGDVAKAYVHMKKALEASRPGVRQGTQPEEQQEQASSSA
jgi:tetratricopeptide (TPR) repeat protein